MEASVYWPKKSVMGSLTVLTALMSQNGLAARTVMRPVSSPVLASQDPVPKFVTVHNGLFAQFDDSVSKIHPYLIRSHNK